MAKVYDFIAVGLGPFNLSLACLTQPITELSGLFLEQRSSFDWHPGLMLDGVHLQTPFMSDLVTLADPTNEFSFLNYAKQNGHLYQFYIREDFFLLRQEYNQYCQWACSKLTNLAFNRKVVEIEYDTQKELYRVVAVTNEQHVESYWAKHIVIGTGPSPYYPKAINPISSKVLHSTQYLTEKENLQASKQLVLVGSGQSAAEIYYDLLSQIHLHNYQITWVTRAPRFFPLEYSKLTLEMTSPEYVDYFYNLPLAQRNQLLSQQKHLYKGINASLINQIYDLLYRLNLEGTVPTQLLTNSELAAQHSNHLSFVQHETGQTFSLDYDKVIMATGFSYQIPQCLAGLSQQINWDHQGRYAVDRYYSIDKQKRVFVQNAELHSHGFVTPDLGMACYRNSHIIRQILGYEYYPIERQIAFQQFGVPSNATFAQSKRESALEELS